MGLGRQHCARSLPKQPVGTARGRRDPAALRGHRHLCLHGAAPLHPTGTAQGHCGWGEFHSCHHSGRSCPLVQGPLTLGWHAPATAAVPAVLSAQDGHPAVLRDVCAGAHSAPPGREGPAPPCSPRQAATSGSKRKKPLWLPQPSPNPGSTPPSPGSPRATCSLGLQGEEATCPGRVLWHREHTGLGFTAGSPDIPQHPRCKRWSRGSTGAGAGTAASPWHGAPHRRSRLLLPSSGRSAPPTPCTGWGPSRAHPKPVLTAAAGLPADTMEHGQTDGQAAPAAPGHGATVAPSIPSHGVCQGGGAAGLGERGCPLAGEALGPCGWLAAAAMRLITSN